MNFNQLVNSIAKSNKTQLMCIVGPTSSGKTSLALRLAQELDAEIVSADSRQIYKEMDIGTGKVPITNKYKIQKLENHWTIEDIKVWGYDLIFPDEYYSSYDYALYARNKINEIINKDKRAFLVGGTGFYMETTTGKMEVSKIKPNIELRKELNRKSLSDLQNELKSLNETKINEIDMQNKVRIIRAIEIEKSNLAKSSETPNNNERKLPELRSNSIRYIGLTAPRESLYAKVDKWVEEIWKNGLIEETEFLLKKYNDNAKLKGIVYKSAVEVIKGNMNNEEAIQNEKFNLHAYIRRQQTWFKKNKDIEWIDISELTER